MVIGYFIKPSCKGYGWTVFFQVAISLEEDLLCGVFRFASIPQDVIAVVKYGGLVAFHDGSVAVIRSLNDLIHEFFYLFRVHSLPPSNWYNVPHHPVCDIAHKKMPRSKFATLESLIFCRAPACLGKRNSAYGLCCRIDCGKCVWLFRRLAEPAMSSHP